MKKFLILALMLLAVFAVLLFLPKRTAGTSYPRDTVETVVSDSAKTLGGRVDEVRTISGQFRGMGRFGRVGRWIRGLVGKNDPESMDQILIYIGSKKITIMSLHQYENVFQLQIQPDPSASTQSADLKREIFKKLPGIDFKP